MPDISFIAQNRQLLTQLLDGRKEMRREMVAYLSSIDEVWARLPKEIPSAQRADLLEKATSEFLDEVRHSSSMLDMQYGNLLALASSAAMASLKSAVADRDERVTALKGENAALSDRVVALEGENARLTKAAKDSDAENGHMRDLAASMERERDGLLKEREAQDARLVRFVSCREKLDGMLKEAKAHLFGASIGVDEARKLAAEMAEI